jgi:hypothetical protein
MMKVRRTWIMAAGLLGLLLSGCKPVQPPPDLIKTQRETLDKAKAFEGQLQQQAQERLKAAEDAQR